MGSSSGDSLHSRGVSDTRIESGPVPGIEDLASIVGRGSSLPIPRPQHGQRLLEGGSDRETELAGLPRRGVQVGRVLAGEHRGVGPPDLVLASDG